MKYNTAVLIIVKHAPHMTYNIPLCNACPLFQSSQLQYSFPFARSENSNRQQKHCRISRPLGKVLETRLYNTNRINSIMNRKTVQWRQTKKHDMVMSGYLEVVITANNEQSNLCVLLLLLQQLRHCVSFRDVGQSSLRRCKYVDCRLVYIWALSYVHSSIV